MNIKNIENKIKKVGGTAEVTSIKRGDDTVYSLNGRIGAYKIHFTTNCSGFFTALKDGTEFDMGSDYNPSGSEFYTKIKDIDYLIK